MANEKFSQLTTGTAGSAGTDYYAGVRDNGDGTYTNYKYPTSGAKKIITVAAAGASLTDVFFANSVTYLMSNNQIFIIGVDFSQDTATNTITGITTTFAAGQVLIAVI